jgi:uncharacterized protein (TIGR02145 family)/uncharacterized repeat protein (TIGR02543 family)
VNNKKTLFVPAALLALASLFVWVGCGSDSNPTDNRGGTTYALSLSASPAACAASITGAGSYNDGANATISVTAAPNCTFTGWSPTAGVADPSAMSTVVAMTQNRTITANFTQGGSGGNHFNPNITYGFFTDSRDGRSYRTVVIGTQTWMAENLNFNASGSRCYGEGGQVFVWDDDFWEIVDSITLSSSEVQANCNRYGRLYDWATVMGFTLGCNSTSCASQVQTRHRGICPTGWHVPSDYDWEILIRHVDPNATGDWNCVAGTILKSTSGWGNYSNGNDDFGFSALPGGYGWEGNFNDVGRNGDWWTANETTTNENFVQIRNMTRSYNHGAAVFSAWSYKTGLISLRCLQD